MRPLDETKIVFSLPFGFTLGGVETWVKTIVPHLCNAHVIAHPEWGFIDASQAYPLDRLHRGDVLIGGLAGRLNEDVYRKLAPAIFIPNYHSGTYEIFAKLMSNRGHGIKVIGMAHSDNPMDYLNLAYFEPIIGTFIATSIEVARQLKRRLPSNRCDDIHVRPCAVDIGRLSAISFSPLRPLKIVYAGRIVSKAKRVFDLVPFLKELQELNIDFELAIAGDGHCRPGLQKSISELGDYTSQRVRFLGMLPQAELFTLFSDSQIFIQCSEYEGTSIAMLEAMGHGCVPVVSKVSGAMDIIKHGENGLLFEIADSKSMAGHISDLSRDFQVLNQLRVNAWESMAMYTPDGYLDWMEGVVLSVNSQGERLWPADKATKIPWRNPMATFLAKILPLPALKFVYQQYRRFSGDL